VKKGLSLRYRIALLFGATVVIITAVFILMNSYFWNRYYMTSNQRAMKEVYENMASFVRQDASGEDFNRAILQARMNKNMTIALQGKGEWEFMVLTDRFTSQYEQEFLLGRLQANLVEASLNGVSILEQGDGYTIQSVVMDDSGERYMECYGFMATSTETEKKFIISMPLERELALSKDATTFTLVISLALLIIGCGAVFFITWKVTKPIYQLSDLSKRISHLDFSVKYSGKQKDEIGVLGNNMNEMSSQLERTILQLQMANETLKKDLEEKNQIDLMRKDFISNVSHELKTPIALIQGYAEGLKEMADDPDSQTYYTDVIIDEAEKMNHMVKKLTKLNQIEFGSDGLQTETFDIMEMIHTIVNGSKKMQEDHHATVTIDGPETQLVVADEYKIEEVLNNYYSNAFNHLEEPNQIRIFLDDLGDYVRISVHNTGNQIPEEELDKIWIKFYKVDKARTRAYGGSGIGLSIVKAIMDAHHQEFGVYNNEDGVTFWFELTKSQMAEEVPNFVMEQNFEDTIPEGEIVKEQDVYGDVKR